MSLLEQLEIDAAEAEAAARIEEEERRRRHEFNTHLLNARLQGLYGYFSKFKTHLESLTTAIIADYEVEGVGTLSGLRQGSYELSGNGTGEGLSHFSLTCEFSAPGKVVTRLGPRVSVRHMMAFFERVNLNVSIVEASGQAAMLKVTNSVPVSLTFTAEPDRGVIRVDLQNFQTLGTDTYRFKPGIMDRKFANELARAVIRQSNDFDAYTGNGLSDTCRLRIKAAVAKARGLKDGPGQSGAADEAPPAKSPSSSCTKWVGQAVARYRGLGRLTGQSSAV